MPVPARLPPDRRTQAYLPALFRRLRPYTRPRRPNSGWTRTDLTQAGRCNSVTGDQRVRSQYNGPAPLACHGVLAVPPASRSAGNLPAAEFRWCRSFPSRLGAPPARARHRWLECAPAAGGAELRCTAAESGIGGSSPIDRTMTRIKGQ